MNTHQTDQEERHDLLNAAHGNGSMTNLMDTSRETRIALRRTRIQTSRLAKQKPSDEGTRFPTLQV